MTVTAGGRSFRKKVMLSWAAKTAGRHPYALCEIAAYLNAQSCGQCVDNCISTYPTVNHCNGTETGGMGFAAVEASVRSLSGRAPIKPSPVADFHFHKKPPHQMELHANSIAMVQLPQTQGRLSVCTKTIPFRPRQATCHHLSSDPWQEVRLRRLPPVHAALGRRTAQGPCFLG
ncbi:hypothetical protein AYL99_11588 [Fonsecaea erecta]|uniref:Uncharacterized protein n=1 Tax=Fonsecaea erecta TaxID=1367422 RepID=A0A178Z2X8_9EURO|nr:hypothetical protein AYL99_11588 [Fonsecaea erecta]OAP54054.1 hypothetical protein AYL99_11588 [Fonsecaea erecta]